MRSGLKRSGISRAEWLWVAVFAVGVMALSSVPYVAGAAAANAEWAYGGFMFGIEDGNSYIGKMRLGAQGQVQFSLFYTPEAHDPAALVFLPYLLPGWLVGRFIPPDDPALTGALFAMFHTMRITFGAGLIATIYAFSAHFLAGPRPRRLATVLATFGGGFGWLLILSGTVDVLGAPPPEFFIPEGFTWLILLSIPHLALARIALLGGLMALMAARARSRWLGWAALAAACWSVMGAAVPFYLAVVYAVVGAWGLAAWLGERRFPWALFARAVVACAFTLPLFAYYALVFAGNPAFAVWSAQNVLESPPPVLYLIAYGLIGGLAALSAAALWRGGEQPRLLIAWAVAAPILVYLPINVQRRMSEAVIVPLAILAAHALTRARPLVRAPLIMLLTASSGLLVLLATLGAASGGSATSALFLPGPVVRAFDALAAAGEPGALALAAPRTGNSLPAYANVRTVMGHGPETLFWPEKTAQLTRFFNGEMPAAERAAWLQNPCTPGFACAGPVRYIVAGPAERALETPRSAWRNDPSLTLIYDRDGVQVYQYTP